MVKAGGGYAGDDEQEEREGEEIKQGSEEEHAVEREEHDAYAAEPRGDHAADATCAGGTSEGGAAFPFGCDARKAFLDDRLQATCEQEQHRAGCRQ